MSAKGNAMASKRVYFVSFLLLVLSSTFCILFNVETITEFSPDDLLFRNSINVFGIHVLNEEWSTELLEEARRVDRFGRNKKSPRWHFVHGRLLFARNFQQGDAQVAYLFFRLDVWENVLDRPRKNRDEIILGIVELFRNERYEDAVDYLIKLEADQKTSGVKGVRVGKGVSVE